MDSHSNNNSFLRSIKGSIKGKLSRSASNASQGSPTQDRGTPGPQPQSRPVRLSAGATSGQGISANPFSNPYSTASSGTRLPHNEPPPSYSSVTTGGATNPYPYPYPSAPAPAYAVRDPSPTPSRLSAIQVSTPEDPYAFLTSFDTIFVIDDSGSMAGRSWREVQSALSSITPICTAHDADGVDIYFLNHRSPYPAHQAHQTQAQAQGKASGGYANVADASAVERIFTTVRPGGMTPTGTRLNHILKAYLRHYEAAVERAGGDPDATDVKPINLIMITDGVPSDDPESVLLSVAQKLDRLEAPPHQVGVQFFQVGNEAGAAEALRALDDDLADLGGGVRDMVDTVTFNVRGGGASSGGGGGGGDDGSGAMPVLSADGILKTVLGAVDGGAQQQQGGGTGQHGQYLQPQTWDQGGSYGNQGQQQLGANPYGYQQQHWASSYGQPSYGQPSQITSTSPVPPVPPIPPPQARPRTDSSQSWQQPAASTPASTGARQQGAQSSQAWQHQQEQAFQQDLHRREEQQR
ncbi:hypothetical protein VM1G_03487 [Cytospora mali]|uniref:VWFA domain-containing protein n=1 Tax=Cytospora mali TaxID=578113 RepID=A0A194VU90_CYTMA|nr:hypothetical protein VM1G_03487 [Valsa mali]